MSEVNLLDQRCPSLLCAGISEQVAMTMTGHKTRSVFMRYDIVSGVDLREAARKLDKAQV